MSCTCKSYYGQDEGCSIHGKPDRSIRCVVCNQKILMAFEGGECAKCRMRRISAGLELADVLAIGTEPADRISALKNAPAK